MALQNKKSLGQHWLKNREILDEIARLTKASAGEATSFCLEIGPGLGTLTAALFRQFDEVMAVEFDEKLANNLPGSFPGKNLKVVNADILKFDFDVLPQSYAIAGNIPYYITGPIIERVLTVQNLPKSIVLLIQKEVAERIVSDKETVLSLKCKNLADVRLGPVVKAAEFTPPPKVDSQIIVMVPHAPVVESEVMELIKRGFKAPRKKLIHNLAGMASKEKISEILQECGLSDGARPGDLHLEDWQAIYQKISN